MLKQLFNIGNSPKPVLVEPIRIRKTKPVTPSLKQDAEKVLERLLNTLQNVNNPKVDALRMLAITLENGGDLATLTAYCKEPIRSKKITKKAKY